MLQGYAVHVHLLAKHLALVRQLPRLLLPGFDADDVSLVFGNLRASGPEDLCVFADFLLRLAIDLVGDIPEAVAAVLGRSADELLEVSPIPMGESLLGQLRLLLLFRFRERRGVIDLLLLELPFGFAIGEVLVGPVSQRNLVPDLLAEVRRLALLQIAQERGKELVVVDGDLLRRARGFGLGLGRAPTGRQRLSVILVHGVRLLLALSLGRVDPGDADLLLAIGKVLSVPLVGRIGRELLQVVDAELLVARVELSRPFLAVLENLVDVVLGQVGPVGHGTDGALGLKDLFRAVLDHVEQFVFGCGSLGGLLRPALLDDQLIETQLLRRPLQHLLLDGVLGDQAKDDHLLGLTDAMCAIHRLQISLWIPVAVIQHHDVRAGQVDPETAGTRRQEEDKLLGVRRVVVVDGRDPILVRGRAIDTAVLEVAEDAVVLENVQHATHLREDQDPASLLLHAHEELVQHDHLARVDHEVLVRGVWRSRLGTFEEVRVVAAFAQLHDDVEKPGLGLSLARGSVDGVNVLFQDLLIPPDLHLRHAHVEVDLCRETRQSWTVDGAGGLPFLGSRLFSTSLLTRRSRKGRRTRCSCCTTVSWSSSWPENQESNASDSPKTSGRRKLSRAQSSCRLFCNGVPVIRSRPRELNRRMICAREDSSFLMRWACRGQRGKHLILAHAHLVDDDVFPSEFL